MSSEQNWNKTDDGTSFKLSEPGLCANGCGFFGTAATMNYCSKCYRDLRIKEEQEASAKVAVEKSMNLSSSTSSSVEERPILVAKTESLVDPLSSSASSSPSSAVVETKASNRCLSCNKKVGLTGFKCRCGSTFCGMHRYPENHDCEFDFKGTGRDAIARANPVIKADKVERF